VGPHKESATHYLSDMSEELIIYVKSCS